MRETAIMVSGGKDSSALIKWCIDKNIKVDRYMFSDTTLRLPIEYDWINNLEERFSIEIERYKPVDNFEELFYRKITRGKLCGEIRGFPPVVGAGCWIKRDMKFNNENFDDVIPIIGYTFSENRDIEKDYIAPFVDAKMNDTDVIKYCIDNDLYPPIYKLLKKYGAKQPRSGCWLCPKSSLSWARMIYFEYPKLWKYLRKLANNSRGWKIEPFEVTENKVKNYSISKYTQKGLKI